MNFLPSFAAWQFALAGLACAAGPVVIHLLNRRRYRVVNWAAMDFLREALQRNRRIMQLRDVLLMLLRAAAVLLFGLALARPFFASRAEAFDSSTALHAVLVIDNSLSMGYQSGVGEESVLDRAKERAREYLDTLPEGSMVSLVPLCGSTHPISADPYPAHDEALLESLQRIEVVDRPASVRRAINEAERAAEAEADLAKRIVLLSDQQQSNWRDLSLAEQGDGPAEATPVQVVDVSAGDFENTWISDFRLEDGLADVETPATFLVELRHRGPAERNLIVSLEVDGEVVAERPVTLEPSEGEALGARRVAFQHVFTTVAPEPGRPVYVPVAARISSDRLPQDDQRHLAAPVVAALPVVFVDEVGAERENAVQGRVGETRHVRSLLAPVSSRDSSTQQLVRVRHITPDSLDRAALEDARLVVLGGVKSLGEAEAELLREYVSQGGQLVIAAGGEFDPAAWNEVAWRGGQGVLPAPLGGRFGILPSEATSRLEPFFLSYESLGDHPWFKLAGVPEEELRDLYAEPFFFQAVEVDAGESMLDDLRAAQRERLEAELSALHEIANQRREREEAGDSSAELTAEQDRLREIRPEWLAWSDHDVEAELAQLPETDKEREQWIDQRVEQTLPRVRARFTGDENPPYLVERNIGRGRVLFVSSGLYSDWNTLPKTNAFLIFDRILRSMVQTTLPQRNFAASRQAIVLPLPGDDSRVEVRLQRPGMADEDYELLDPGFVTGRRRGVLVESPLQRGVYRLRAAKPDVFASQGAAAAENDLAWRLTLAVAGDGAESDLTRMSRGAFEDRYGSDGRLQWVGPGETISLAGVQVRGQSLWKWLILLVLILLIVEILVLAWPQWRARREVNENPTAV